MNDKFEIVTENKTNTVTDSEKSNTDSSFLKPITNLSTNKSVSISNIAGKISHYNKFFYEYITKQFKLTFFLIKLISILLKKNHHITLLKNKLTENLIKKETAYLSTSKDFLANLNVKNKVTEVNFNSNFF